MGKNKIKMWYDEEMDILYISFKKGECVDSEEVNENIRIEYNRNGEVIGLEILGISRYLAKSIAKNLKSVMAK